MYNEKYKNEFLSILNSIDVVNYMSLFIATEEIERKVGKDLCEMDKYDIASILKIYKYKTSIDPTISRMRKYFFWAYSKNYISSNIMDKSALKNTEIYSLLDELGNRYYLSPSLYETYKNTILDSNNGLYMGSLFMALYEGISGRNFENLEHLRVSDLHRTRVKLYDGTELTISNELRELLIATSNVNQLTGVRVMSLKYSKYHDSIWRFVKDNNNFPRTVNTFFYNPGKIKDITNDKNLTARVVMRSGLFNYVIKRSNDLGLDLKNDFKNITRENTMYNRILTERGVKSPFASFKVGFIDWIDYIK